MINLGYLKSKKDLRNYKIVSTPKTTQNLPSTFCLINNFKIKDQGNVGSCVAHAISSVLEYHDQNQNQLSTNFIYGIKRKLFYDSNRGMYLADACTIVSQYGDMLELDCKGNNEIPEVWDIAELAFEDYRKRDRALQFKIRYYFSCKTTNDIKLALYQYGPVIAGIKWFDKTTADQSGNFIYNKNNPYAYHCIMIYGWNEQGFLCQNSFGENWGNKGCFILPFDYEIDDCRALVDDYNPNEETLIIPKRNWFLNIWYKIANWFINLFN